MTDSSLATTSSISLLTRGKEGKHSSYAAAVNVPSSVSISERKKLDIFSSDVHPAPLCSKKKHEKKPDSLKKKPDSLVQLKEIEPKAAAATAVPKRKKSAVQSYSLNRSACKILGDQPDKKRKKMIMDVLEKKPDSLKKKPDSLVQLKEIEPKAAAVTAVPKRKKMIMDVLGMDVLSVNFSQASMDDANVLSFPSATSSIMKEAIKAAKVVIKKQDIRIKELENQINVDIKKKKYVPPPKVLGEKWTDGRCYFGKERLLSEMERKHHWLHFLISIPQHCRSNSEKASIKTLFSWFEKENRAGNIGGERCGLGEMWVFPPNKRRTVIKIIAGYQNSFREYINITCKGESPSLEEGIAALKMGRAGQNKRLMKSNQELYDETYFEEGEYMISVPRDIIKHHFKQDINQNASMWITSGGVVVYAFKNERDNLMIFTMGSQIKSQSQTCYYAERKKKQYIGPSVNDDGYITYF